MSAEQDANAAGTASQRGADRRQKMLHEAAKALNARGVSKTSLAEVAEAAGVSRAAIYYHFDDQQDLVFQCYRRSCNAMLERFQDAVKGQSETLGTIDQFIDAMLADEEPELAALSEPAFLRDDQRLAVLDLYGSLRLEIALVLERGINRLEMRACDAGLMANAIIGLIGWVPSARAWGADNPVSNEAMAGAIKLILREGIAFDRDSSGYQPIELATSRLPLSKIFDANAMAAARREAVLAAASWLFNLKGIDATSLDEIAARLGVTKKVIYHNAGDKEALVESSYRRAFDFYQGIADSAEAYAGSRLNALCAAVRAVIEAGLSAELAPLAPYGNLEALPLSVRAELRGRSDELNRSYVRMMQQGQAEGSIRPFEILPILSVMPGLFEWLPKWLDALDAAEVARAPGELINLLRIGLRQA